MTRSEDELRAFFRTELRPHVERWKALPRWKPPSVFDWIVVALALAACVVLRRAEPLWLLAGLVAFRVMREVVRIQRAFKEEVLRRVFEFALPGVEYDPRARIAPGVVERSGLFQESWNHESGEDYVAARLGATEFEFSELSLTRKKKDNHQLVFRGLFFTADFHKSFRGRTYLLPDLAERTLGTLGRAFQALPQFDGTELVELEDPDFEKRFVCRSTDPTEARYLLSTSMIQRLLQLSERTRSSLRISFVDESLYLAMPLGDLFQAPFTSAGLDEETLLARGRELLSVVGLVEELDLNTRIWSKT